MPDLTAGAQPPFPGAQAIHAPPSWRCIDFVSDLHLHAEGNLHETWNTLGAHVTQLGAISGVRFAVWAPTAAYVSVVWERGVLTSAVALGLWALRRLR